MSPSPFTNLLRRLTRRRPAQQDASAPLVAPDANFRISTIPEHPAIVGGNPSCDVRPASLKDEITRALVSLLKYRHNHSSVWTTIIGPESAKITFGDCVVTWYKHACHHPELEIIWPVEMVTIAVKSVIVYRWSVDSVATADPRFADTLTLIHKRLTDILADAHDNQLSIDQYERIMVSGATL